MDDGTNAKESVVLPRGGSICDLIKDSWSAPAVNEVIKESSGGMIDLNHTDQ